MNRFVVVIACTLIASPAHAQVVASAGFNNLSGINSTSAANSPYNVKNASILGQGAGEPGWKTTWQGGPINFANVVNANTYEGDGALLLQGTSQVYRTLSAGLSGTESMTFEVMILSTAGVMTGGNDFYLMDSSIANSGLRVATQADPNPSGHWSVLDGVRDGAGNNVDTGLAWTPGVYQQLRFDVNATAGYWDFYVNGVHYNPGHHLGFRGTPGSIDEVNLLGGLGAPNGIYIDDISIVPIPEPSSLFLLGTAICFVVLRKAP